MAYLQASDRTRLREAAQRAFPRTRWLEAKDPGSVYADYTEYIRLADPHAIVGLLDEVESLRALLHEGAKLLDRCSTIDVDNPDYRAPEEAEWLRQVEETLGVEIRESAEARRQLKEVQ